MNLVTLDLIGLGLPTAGRLGIFLYEAYTRPSEGVAVSSGQVAVPHDDATGAGWWLTFTVHPEKQTLPNKVREYDRGSPFLPMQQLLVALVLRLVKVRQGKAPLWLFDYEAL